MKFNNDIDNMLEKFTEFYDLKVVNLNIDYDKNENNYQPY